MRKCVAYLDIETTGLSFNHDITVVGILKDYSRALRFIQLIGGDITKRNLKAALRGVSRVYTYNGVRFDLPFLECKHHLKIRCEHVDLMHWCHKYGIYGGMRGAETKLGVGRTTYVNGREAVILWHEYRDKGSLDALKDLLRYNMEDVYNLKVLKEKLERYEK